MLRPLNVDHATGPSVDLIKDARRRYYKSAGGRPTGGDAPSAGGARPDVEPERTTPVTN
jgi:hypothetical protein